MDAAAAAELAARAAYGRLLSIVAARTGDVAAAEDALADAFEAALRHWPAQGVPARPLAWLVTAAKRRRIDRARRVAVEEAAVATLLASLDDAPGCTEPERDPAEAAFGDERLRLLLLCAHPAIEAAIRTPLMLQAVLGLDAARIGRALNLPAATVGQRLVRAKAKMRLAGIPMALPPPAELAARLPAVLDAVYAAYGLAWAEPDRAAVAMPGLAAEAIWLARLLVRLLPAEPEPLGLLALLLYVEARAAAHREGGAYRPLDEQDPAGWDAAAIDEAEACLVRAAGFGRLGRYQLEAAIQSAHAARRHGRPADPEAIALLYEGLVRLAPSLGALVGRAAATARARGPALGLALLDQLPAAEVAGYQPFWAVRAQLLAESGATAAAGEAYARAITITPDAAVRVFLERRRTALGGSTSA